MLRMDREYKMKTFSKPIELETKNLRLRQWKPSDYLPFSKLNADKDVMQYFPNTISEEESNELALKLELLIAKKGWGVWAVELKESHVFIGFLGLYEFSLDLPFSPCVEIAWRFDKKYWGNGYATEAGKEVLKFAFDVLGLDEVVSFTTVANKKSESVMKKLNMINAKEDFEHPNLAKGHHLSTHVLYRISKR